jgi:uncharacterized protein YcbX
MGTSGAAFGGIVEIWRYPVKSMLGEPLDAAELEASGLTGDRQFALIDLEDGTVASAKHPRRWAKLLSCRARMRSVEVDIDFGDGLTTTSEDPEVDAVLSRWLGRSVRLARVPPAGAVFEEMWPDIEGLAPQGVIAATTTSRDADARPISSFPISLAGPQDRFFDVSALHLMTTASLQRLRDLSPASTFDARRYRPNIVIEPTDEVGFVENGWAGREIRLGPSAVAHATIPTMRCVMTTLAQSDLPQDRSTLRTIAAHNRLDIPGMGVWACVGVYADVAVTGSITRGDPVSIIEPEVPPGEP